MSKTFSLLDESKTYDVEDALSGGRSTLRFLADNQQMRMNANELANMLGNMLTYFEVLDFEASRGKLPKDWRN